MDGVRLSRFPSFAAHAFALLVVAVYLAQHMTLAPNPDDGGAAFRFVHKVSEGHRVHFDFVDWYGPLAWQLPALFYDLFGQQVMGIRLYMLLLKLVTVVLIYAFVRRLSNRFYAGLASALSVVFLGLPWPMFEVPYAHHLTLVLCLAIATLAFAPSGPPSLLRLSAIAALTAVALAIKVTTGAFVFAAILFYLFYLLPAAGDGGGASETSSAPRLVRAAQLAGLVAYAGAFHALIAKHFAVLHVLYLSVPLLLALGVTARLVLRASPDDLCVSQRVRAWAAYFSMVVAFAVAIFLGYFGPSAFIPYLAEQAAILSAADYAGDFPAIGKAGLYRGFAEYLWPQLPWLVTAVFCVWWALRARTDAKRDRRDEQRVVAVFVLVTLYTFVIYPHADETHLMQAVLLAAPVLYIFAFYVERLWAKTAPRSKRFRSAIAILTVFWALPLVSLPDRHSFDWGHGDWGSKRLAHLRYHADPSPYFNVSHSLRSLDRAHDEAARQINTLTADETEILVLGQAPLLYYASHTRPVADKYSHLIYLLGHGVLDRHNFERLVPPAALRSLLKQQPSIVVDVLHQRHLGDQFPELRSTLVGGGYRLVGRWDMVRVYRRVTGAPKK